ncbi:MAG: hypothetical protein JO093_15215 [Acidobacteria bacterium]|nr:hypothetical protein [Acidobacteriota bacterium]MBV9186964.1 hypothetical protein [Acidobacteriota bacterium]
MRHVVAAGALLLLLSFSPDVARASCGSSSCPIDLHALQFGDGKFSLDLSFQYIDQDQPRIGSRRAHVGAIASDHDEIRTINRLTTLQLNYSLNERFQMAVTLPYVSRSHEHFDEENARIERWNFADAGDATVQGRIRLFASDSLDHSSLWLTGGVKLPTGSKRETGSTGEDAEVTIVPGTGSTDALLGVSFQSGTLRDTALQGEMGHTTLIPFFIALNGRLNGRGTHDYRRGHELQLNAGTEYPLTSTIHLLGQINGRMSGKDDVGQTDENRDLTGARYLYLSPGVRLLLGWKTSIYGFVQLPVYQHVNGLQLTSKVNYLAGVHKSF